MTKPIGYQKVLTKNELTRDLEITGPDTLMYNYQKARFYKNYPLADKIKEQGIERGLKLSFCGDHYETFIEDPTKWNDFCKNFK